ncbi:MAG: aminotransferase class I/II-fold pyridoxal phosphate-dependent enzyme [Candidatus Bathyarchaeia archaeon]|jgi:aspartate/methionine/tyrosine aminotransferase
MFLEEVENSPSLEMVNLVLAKVAKGEKVVSLAIGEPSFNTPTEIVEVACEAMRSGDVHYTSSYGTSEVREAIKRKTAKKNGIHAEIPNTIFCTTKYSVYAALAAASNKAYDALLPDPGYFYWEPVVLSGGRPVFYTLNKDFSLDIDDIKKKTTRRTKVILVNSPSNPTGKVLKRTELKELYEFCRDRKIFIISDEAYEDLVYDGQHFCVGSLEPKPEFVISLFSLSKSYAMTGWRAGYVVASERIIYLINKFLENTVTCFPPFIQKASAYALDNGDKYIAKFRTELENRKKLLASKIEEIDALEPYKTEGAFYAFPRYTKKMRSRELVKVLLDKYGIAVLAGASFGHAGENHLRFSFSMSPETIENGMDKVKTFFKEG